MNGIADDPYQIVPRSSGGTHKEGELWTRFEEMRVLQKLFMLVLYLMGT